MSKFCFKKWSHLFLISCKRVHTMQKEQQKTHSVHKRHKINEICTEYALLSGEPHIQFWVKIILSNNFLTLQQYIIICFDQFKSHSVHLNLHIFNQLGLFRKKKWRSHHFKLVWFNFSTLRRVGSLHKLLLFLQPIND